jgi:alkaline phosphatase D
VLSGDSHAFWANDLLDARGRLVAAEFGTSSISSPSVGDALPGLPLGQLIAQANDEVAFCDQNAKGFVLLTLTKQAARGDFIAVSTILSREFQTRQLASFSVEAGVPARRLRGAN